MLNTKYIVLCEQVLTIYCNSLIEVKKHGYCIYNTPIKTMVETWTQTYNISAGMWDNTL